MTISRSGRTKFTTQSLETPKRGPIPNSATNGLRKRVERPGEAPARQRPVRGGRGVCSVRSTVDAVGRAPPEPAGDAARGRRGRRPVGAAYILSQTKRGRIPSGQQRRPVAAAGPDHPDEGAGEGAAAHGG